jgi:hypothetical protein
VHGFGGHAFLLTYAILIAVVPILLFNVPKAVGWSVITTFLAYGIPILAILIVLPQNEVSG